MYVYIYIYIYIYTCMQIYISIMILITIARSCSPQALPRVAQARAGGAGGRRPRTTRTGTSAFCYSHFCYSHLLQTVLEYGFTQDFNSYPADWAHAVRRNCHR